MKFNQLTKKNQNVAINAAKAYFNEKIDNYYGKLESHKLTKAAVKRNFNDNFIMHFNFMKYEFLTNCGERLARDMGEEVAAYVLCQYYDIIGYNGI